MRDLSGYFQPQSGQIFAIHFDAGSGGQAR